MIYGSKEKAEFSCGNSKSTSRSDVSSMNICGDSYGSGTNGILTKNLELG